MEALIPWLFEKQKRGVSHWEWPGEPRSSPHLPPCREIGVQHQALCHRVVPTRRRGPPLLKWSLVYPTPGRKEDLGKAPDHEYLFGTVDVSCPLGTRYDLHQQNSATLRIPYTTQPLRSPVHSTHSSWKPLRRNFALHKVLHNQEGTLLRPQEVAHCTTWVLQPLWDSSLVVRASEKQSLAGNEKSPSNEIFEKSFNHFQHQSPVQDHEY